MADPATLLATRLSSAIEAAFGPAHAGVDPLVRRSQEPRFGDYQANVAMSLGRLVGLPPREVAARIVAGADLEDLCEPPEVAGAGFINLRLRPAALVAALVALAADGRAGVVPAARPGKVVVDYSGPNLAKEMHVGHLRSTIIGDAVVRVLELAGHRVVRQNHVGDWGTQFGMLIEHLAQGGWDSGGDHTIGDLDDLYRQARSRFDGDPGFADQARRRVVELQGGDEATMAIWQALVQESERHMQAVYQRLGVLLAPADVRGESFYNPQLPEVVAELEGAGLTAVDDGALCVFPPGFTRRDGQAQPMIVRKRDGGYGYDATDLAAVRWRARQLGATRLVYVVDARQTQHFAMVFAVARMAGWLGQARGKGAVVDAGGEAAAEHASFGTILGADGRPFQTRRGETVKLADLLDEAVERAAAVVADKAPDLDDQARAAVARAVGIGAVKYADLASDRVKDYVFDWSRMLSFDGNAAPYLQMAHARIRSIFRRAGAEGAGTGETFGPTSVDHPAERALALHLLGFASTVAEVADTLQPHRLCTHLFELAQLFTTFYEHCPVLRADQPEQRASRLALCGLTAAVLSLGLGLLGIEAPDQM